MKPESCRKCAFSTNSSIENNDPFVQTRLPIIWYCSYNEELIVVNEEEVDKDCPL